MESERLLMAAGLTAAAVVSAFIFWGPSSSNSAHSGNRGRLAGLVNLGRTCFLNAVLHALAACPLFIEWLDRDKSLKDTSLRRTLSTVLSVVNGTNKAVKDTYAPSAVINALERLGWVIPNGEQDAHELLNVLLTTLDEETNQLGRKWGCLSDALLCADPDEDDDHPGRDDVMQLSHSLNPSSNGDTELATSPMSEQNPLGSSSSLNEFGANRPSSLQWRFSTVGTVGRPSRNRWISRSCRNLMGTARQMSGPPTQPQLHPFAGTLTSQLRCTECGRRSPVRYDRFATLSLALPPPPPGTTCTEYSAPRHKLTQLLANFVAPEIVADVECGGCSVRTTTTDAPASPTAHSRQVKMLNFGKLPACLCVHLIRNQWQNSGLRKRTDYVQFPMRLSLADYTFVQAQYAYACSRQRRRGHAGGSTSEGGSPLNSYVPMVGGGSWRHPPSSSTNENSINDNGGAAAAAIGGCGDFRNIYQLAAVIVHSGDAHSGHFVTYRRGQSQKSKWYYTSDIEIREVSVEEVQRSTAYMLFYEKTTNFNSFPINY